jgi:hypothetical protein
LHDVIALAQANELQLIAIDTLSRGHSRLPNSTDAIAQLEWRGGLTELLAVAGISFWNIYFKLVQGPVRSPEIVTFLRPLRQHLGDRQTVPADLHNLSRRHG